MYTNYQLQFLPTTNRAEYARLWDKLTEPVEFHDVVVRVKTVLRFSGVFFGRERPAFAAAGRAHLLERSEGQIHCQVSSQGMGGMHK